jgi:OFA family oxalate/formate antiporter-like MFS transporter
MAPARPLMLAGALLLSVVYGSIHAYSVLMAPLEAELGASRGALSLGYALAIGSLTAGVLAAPAMLRAGPSLAAAGAGVVAGVGLLVASVDHALGTFLVGYGLAFGLANGMSYVLFLDRAAHALPRARGLSVGLVTAGYGAGAAVAAIILGRALEAMAATDVLAWLALAVLVSGIVAALAFRGGRTQERTMAAEIAASSDTHLFRLWLVYFLAAAGGLMVIAHASEIAAALGLGREDALIAPAAVAVGNIAGSLAGGVWAERLRPWPAIGAGQAIAILATALLFLPEPAVLTGLLLWGLAYGALISTVPVIVRRREGDGGFSRNFSRVFTAWGAAGLAAPAAAGYLFDAVGNYGLALATAGIAALAATLLAARL